MNRIVLLIAGIALIGFGFVSLVEIDPWPKQVWLDLVVALLVFQLNFSNISLITRRVSQFSGSIPSLGIIWTLDGLYTVAAIGGLVAAHLLHWTYPVSLMVQMTLVFGVLVMLSFAARANTHAAEVQKNEAVTLASLDQLRSMFASRSPAVIRSCAAYSDIQQDLTRIGEDLRYLAAAPNPTARSLETQLQSELQNVFETITRSASPEMTLQLVPVRESLIRIKDLIQQRKFCYNSPV